MFKGFCVLGTQQPISCVLGTQQPISCKNNIFTSDMTASVHMQQDEQQQIIKGKKRKEATQNCSVVCSIRISCLNECSSKKMSIGKTFIQCCRYDMPQHIISKYCAQHVEKQLMKIFLDFRKHHDPRNYNAPQLAQLHFVETCCIDYSCWQPNHVHQGIDKYRSTGQKRQGLLINNSTQVFSLFLFRTVGCGVGGQDLKKLSANQRCQGENLHS